MLRRGGTVQCHQALTQQRSNSYNSLQPGVASLNRIKASCCTRPVPETSRSSMRKKPRGPNHFSANEHPNVGLLAF